MPMLLTKTALADYLSVSTPVSGRGPSGGADDSTEVRQEISKTLAWGNDGLHSEGLHFLWKTLEVAVHLDRASQHQWHLLAIIREACREVEFLAPLSETAVWTTALIQAASLIGVTGSAYRFGSDSRQETVANALRFLQAKGYRFEVDGHGVRIERKSYEKLCAKIEKHIACAGGLAFSNSLLNHMGTAGRIIEGSLISARMMGTLYKAPSPEVPFHFLYNLALKHLGTAGRSDHVRNIAKAETYARHLAAALDVQPHSVYENLTMPSKLFERALRETAVYDELFGFPQWQPRSATFLIGRLMNALSETGCDFPFASPPDWVAFCESIHRLASINRLREVSSITVAADLNWALTDTERLLDQVSISARSVNKEYRWPTDAANRHNARYPLIKIAEQSYVLQPRAIVARALFERLSELMRDQIKRASGRAPANLKRLETKFGKALEIVTTSVLRDVQANVTIEGGKYFGKGKSEQLEIDAVVETEDRIFLFECKKKALTTKARGGELPALLKDLNDSCLSMHAQLARHEAKLRQDGKIAFRDGKVLHLNGRQIERIAVSLFDHGALQDRGVVMPLLERLIGHKLLAETPEHLGLVEEMNKNLRVIGESLKLIQEYGPKGGEEPVANFTMSTWWLSIDQIHYLCGSGKGLWEALRPLRHLTSRSGDIIWEVNRVTHLSDVGKQLLDVAQIMNGRAFL